MLAQAGLPTRVLNLAQGYGEEAGWPLVNHPEVDVVAFTGSYEISSRIRGACAVAPWKLAVCEMGGHGAGLCGLMVTTRANHWPVPG
jgi:acyl-CoA reductase-like NAD-dependent aldehyde dehydrogenase